MLIPSNSLIPELPPGLLETFLAQHGLSKDFCSVIEHCYLPLLGWIISELKVQAPLVLGINGAQGTGKSTLADFLATALAHNNIVTAVLSLDDFYLGPLEREELAQDIHPLLKTRGVPGTHDVAEMKRCIHQLKTLKVGEQLQIPRFSKAIDDRKPEDQWPVITGQVDLIILEGWCVASQPQSDEQLREPVNSLEREQDIDSLWRRFVNRQLQHNYADAFDLLDRLVFLAAPDFESVMRWRSEQETQLAKQSGADSPGIMDNDQLQNFMQHYERLTGHNLMTLNNIADVHVMFDQNHQCTNITFRD